MKRWLFFTNILFPYNLQQISPIYIVCEYKEISLRYIASIFYIFIFFPYPP